jgi:hypothetical protein
MMLRIARHDKNFAVLKVGLRKKRIGEEVSLLLLFWLLDGHA